MNKYLIEKLKEGRLKKGLKQSDVTSLTGIKNTTLSNYENGNTEPDMDTFLKLCHLYELDYSELLGEAYGYRISGISIDIKKSDIDMIKKYRSLDPYGQETVNTILDRESTRVTALHQKDERIKELEDIASQIQTEDFYLNAAHDDETSTPEERQAGDDIMMDDSEWE